MEEAERAAPLSSRDAELVLTYLTAPYLRIPLLLGFFADHARLPALGGTRMQAHAHAAPPPPTSPTLPYGRNSSSFGAIR